MMAPFFYLVMSLLLRQAASLTKVIVPAVYKEWIHEKPAWARDPAIMEKYGYTVFQYQKLDPSAPHYFGYNLGTETAVYLKYIVDHYDDFPDVAIFVHAHPHGHSPHFLEQIGCISPNATWYSINYNYQMWMTRDANYWAPTHKTVPMHMDQCWRDVLQTSWDLRDNLAEFQRRMPPTTLVKMTAECCNQFMMSRAMVLKKPLHVWKNLLEMLGTREECHPGKPDDSTLALFNKQNEPIETEKEEATRRKDFFGGMYQGGTGEHLSHVIFGDQPLMMSRPTHEEVCQNYLAGCPLSPCGIL